jgi:hypothetical protein
MHTKFRLERLKGRDSSDNEGTYGITLKLMLRESGGRVLIGFNWPSGPVVTVCEHRNALN